ncbi:hypothetical protein [Marinicellulosiphila megalodicopiae]|uniref:hypothetical protein n=1 Tax=Marinicellulosiphila megalodicopiae TaxID=2724896 RepID=UPI003BB1F4BC
MSIKSLYFVAAISYFSSSFVFAESESVSVSESNESTSSIVSKMTENQTEKSTDAENNTIERESKSDRDKQNDVTKVNENIRFAVNVSALELPFPLSAGISVIYQKHPKWMVEFNYMRNLFALDTLKGVQSEELGQQHFSVKAHYFVRDHYYATVGLGKRYTRARLSDEYFDYNNYSVDSAISKFNTDYLTFGVGSVFKLNEHTQLNVDWAAINLGFSKETTQSAADLIDEVDVKKEVLDQEEILEQYMSATFLRVSIMGQY